MFVTLAFFRSLLISCMPVSAVMAIMYMLFIYNKRISIICDPWLGHCILGILKRYLFSFYFFILCKSVREACSVSIDFWIRLK